MAIIRERVRIVRCEILDTGLNWPYNYRSVLRLFALQSHPIVASLCLFRTARRWQCRFSPRILFRVSSGIESILASKNQPYIEVIKIQVRRRQADAEACDVYEQLSRCSSNLALRPPPLTVHPWPLALRIEICVCVDTVARGMRGGGVPGHTYTG